MKEISTLQQLSIQYQQADSNEEPGEPPPEPSRINIDDLPPSNARSWAHVVWEKACKAVSILMQWLRYVFKSINCAK